MRRRLIAVIAALVVLAGCSAQATDDRGSGKGKDADITTDAWNVTVFKNANAVPNMALFCINRADPIAILSTLSGGDTGVNKTATFVPMPKLDAPYCGGRAQ